MKDNLFFNIIQACQSSNCPVCIVVQDGMDHYFENLFYENVNDPGMRETLRGSQGFCNLHTWQILDRTVPESLGIAIISEDIFKQTIQQLKKLEAGFRPGKPTHLLKGKRPCPACEQLETSTRHAIETILQYLDDQEMKPAIENSHGLCIPHLQKAIQIAPDEHKARFLLKIQIDKMSVLIKELSEYIRKNDYRFRDEGFGVERDSWKRALKVISGERNTSYPEANHPSTR